jgi:hypothetical protein
MNRSDSEWFRRYVIFRSAMKSQDIVRDKFMSKSE